jgi:regulatory protein
VPRVTGLRETRSGRIAVDLDGARWRTLPADVVARAGLGVGEELDRSRLRTLARELRRSRAFGVAGRALRYRDLSSESLRRRLADRGVAAGVREETLETLERAGVVDDERYARTRAERLSARLGDLAIRDDLERRGVPAELVTTALAGLEPESERAARIAAARGASLRTAADLARRGFGEDAIVAAVPVVVADE